jgi:hypothetical protein
VSGEFSTPGFILVIALPWLQQHAAVLFMAVPRPFCELRNIRSFIPYRIVSIGAFAAPHFTVRKDPFVAGIKCVNKSNRAKEQYYTPSLPRWCYSATAEICQCYFWGSVWWCCHKTNG